MTNRLYFISSVFFLIGAVWANHEASTPVTRMYLLGSIFFLLAAVTGLRGSRRK